ncbi:MAG: tetratricopeptide repeat protein [Anaerolineaceae bacterium]
MPRISLRAYEKQIEDLIEQNRLQEAVEHCRHILRTFPKCISTYRILGKALLEGKQYKESADVFKRVLAVYPDDFIAHVGMSIVSENADNLDAAIWHMELAFDSQPSNITIQEELKRLFGRRDGTHPAKIRLTRGALVRMYARGELYPQAIAEIKSALAEDGKRLDLKVLLAKMDFLLGDASESINLCNQLIVELPYCYEINKILVALLPTSNKSEKTPVYLDRLKALNPYEAFIDGNIPTEADVPDDKVTIDQLDYSEQPISNDASGWVSAIESKWEEPTNLDSLDWLPVAAPNESSLQPQAQPLVDSSSAQPEETTDHSKENVNADSDLPDWMRSAGWLPTEEPTNTVEPPQTNVPGDVAENAVESTDLPDWLRSLEPEKPETPAESAPAFTENDLSAPDQSSVISQPENILESPASEENAPDGENDLPDWLKNFEVEGSSETTSSDDLPDWMKSIHPIEQPVNLNETTEEQTPPTSQDQINPESVTSESEANLDNLIGPDVTGKFTRNLDQNFVSPDGPEITLAPNSPALPEDWKSNLEEEPSPAPENTSSQGDADIPDWVRSVMQEAPANQENIPTKSPSSVENPLDQPAELNLDQDADSTSPVLSEKSGDDLLSWLRDLKPEEETGSDEETGATPLDENAADEIPSFDDDSPLDRLQGLTEKEAQPIQETTEPLSEEELNLPESSEVQTVTPSPFPINDEPILQTSGEEIASPISDSEPISVEISDQLMDTPGLATSETSYDLSDLANKILAGESISEIIDRLSQLTDSEAENYQVWQLLGDAYAKTDDFSSALRSYDKAEELILKSK